MTTTVATNPAATNPAATTTTSSADKLAGDMQNFLKLLTTQLQYQDPLKPTDSTQFVTQLAMFSQAEQGVNTNKRLDTLVDLTRGRSLSDAASFLGKTVTVVSDALSFDGTHPARFSYEVPDKADKVTVRVYDEVGRPVRVVQGKADAGLYEDAWNGIDDRGATVEPGNYRIEVEASIPGETGTTSKLQKIPTTVRGVVDEMRVVDGKVMAVIAGKEIDSSKITGVAGTDDGTLAALLGTTR